MHDGARLFLLSVAAIPACSDGTARPSIIQACETYITNTMQCYSEFYATGGAPTDGASYDSTGIDYVTGESGTYDPARYCQEYASIYESYSAACQDAIADSWACLSRLDCAALMDGDAADAACKKTDDQGRQTCPELFPLCQAVGFSTGDENNCGIEESECADGKRYGVTCTVEMTMLNCTCQVDGVDGKTYSVAGSCTGSEFSDVANAECGFPDSVLEPESDDDMGRRATLPSPQRLPPRLQRPKRSAQGAKRL